MAEEEEEQAPQEGEVPPPPPPKKKKSLLMQFIVLAVIILAGQGAAVYFLFHKSLLPKLEPEKEGEEKAAISRTANAPKIPIDTPFLVAVAADKEEILVNPIDEIMIRFLNAQVIVQMVSEAGFEELQDDVKRQKVRDVVRRTLANTRYEKMDEPDERRALRDTVKARINASGILEAGEVERVFFLRFVLN